MKPFFSIIIPVYNDAVNLGKLLDAIYKSSFLNFEVIVVDDASTDPEVKKTSKSYPVKYISHKQNRCVAAARNTGAKNSKADIFIFFDSDIMIERNTLKRFFDAHKSSHKEFYQPLCSRCAVNKGFGPDLVALIWCFDYFGKTRFSLHSQAFSIRKKVFLYHGGFDERFTGLGAEEFEFGHRLEKSITLHSDPNHLLSQNYETIFPRARSLFKRTVRYTLMFLFKTRKFEAQGGTPKAVFSSFVAVFPFLILPLLFVTPQTEIVAPLLWAVIGCFFAHTLLNVPFLFFLKKERGIGFSVFSIGAIFLWSLATGLGITFALIIAAFMVCSGRRYDSMSIKT